MAQIATLLFVGCSNDQVDDVNSSTNNELKHATVVTPPFCGETKLEICSQNSILMLVI